MEPDERATSMTDRTHEARQTPVSECVKLLPIEPLLVSRDVDPLTIVRASAARPATRVIGVVDPGGKLIGILPVLRLVETVIAKVSPETLLAGNADLEEAARFGNEISAHEVADVMLPPISILGTATVDDAFRLMHAEHQSGLHVVDGEGRPTGYLDLLELALRYLEALEPPDQPTTAG
jgi:CBS domain-containing protein